MKNLPTFETFVNESFEPALYEATAADKANVIAAKFLDDLENELKIVALDYQMLKMSPKGFMVRVVVKDANDKVRKWINDYKAEHENDLGSSIPMSFGCFDEIPGQKQFWPADNKKFFDIIRESLNEAKGPDMKDVQRLQKEFETKVKFIKNMKGMNWRTATEPVIVTNKDLDLKGSASGNYMITAVYKMYGPAYKVEYVVVEQNPKFPKTMGTYTKTLDAQVWEKFVHAHDKQFEDPSRLSPASIKTLSPMVAQFVTDELNAYFGSNAGPADTSTKGLIEDAFRDAEVSEISGNRLRVDFFVKRAGDGKNVGKTNLLFIVSPEHQTVEFKNPDSRNPLQDTYTDIKDLSRFIKSTMRDWKAADREKYEESNYQQWRSEN